MKQLTICRRLDAGERFFWLLDRVSGMNFVVFAELSRAIDPKRLRAGLDYAQQAHPLLRVTIVEKPEGELWFEPAQASIDCRMIAVDDSNWQKPIEDAMSHRFNLGDAPLMRCLHLPFHDQDRSIVALTFHHAIADGRSGTALLRELLQYLADPHAGNHFSDSVAHSPMHDIFPEQFQWSGQPQAVVQIQEARRADLKRYGRPSPLSWLEQHQQQRLPRFVRIALDEEQTRHLLGQCRHNGATLHGALGAAQLMATYQSLGVAEPATLSLGSPADMRPYLDEQITVAGLGLYVTLLFSCHQAGGRHTFWELAREVSADIKRQLQRGDGHLLFAQSQPEAFPPTPQGIEAFAKIILASPQSSMISNIGRVAPMENAEHIDAISFVLCPMPYQMMFSAVSTFGDRLLINMAYDAAKLTDERAQQLAHWLRHGLLHHDMALSRSSWAGSHNPL